MEVRAVKAVDVVDVVADAAVVDATAKAVLSPATSGVKPARTSSAVLARPRTKSASFMPR
jgi:hypothetical protein